MKLVSFKIVLFFSRSASLLPTAFRLLVSMAIGLITQAQPEQEVQCQFWVRTTSIPEKLHKVVFSAKNQGNMHRKACYGC